MLYRAALRVSHLVILNVMKNLLRPVYELYKSKKILRDAQNDNLIIS